MKKKIIACITGLAIAVMIAGPGTAQAALTESQVQAILNLLESFGADTATVANVEAALRGEPVTPVTPEGIPAGFTFEKNLSSGMSDPDVVYLKIVLDAEVDHESWTGSEYFASKTKAAVVAFQTKYKDEISATVGYTISCSGYVGPGTRTQLNALLVVTPPAACTVDADCDAGYVCTAGKCVKEEVAAGLTVRLASDTPEAGTVAATGNANFTKFKLTAGSEGSVSISKIYVTRSGLSANSDVEKIKIVDVETGAYKGSIGSLNTNNEAMISFVPSLVIPAGETKEYYIRAGVTSGATSDGTIKLGIAAATDIKSDASEVSGDFPITGNSMGKTNVTIGGVQISELTLTDTTPDVGDTDVPVMKFKLKETGTEPVTVETITVKKAGTADANDVNNIELYDITAGESLGTVDAWDAESKATWSDLDIVIGKGDSNRFEVRVDIVDGVGLKVNADIIDGTDVLVTVKGNTYGFYLTPDETTWGGTNDGKGTDQTINSGSLTITKSSSTPATGNVAPGDDVTLAVFDFEAKGEDIKITTLSLIATDTTSIARTELTNVTLYDEDGDPVCGPSNFAEDTGNWTVDYTDTFIVPVGTHQYTAKVDIADAVSSGDTIGIGVEDPEGITATGMTSGDSIASTSINSGSSTTVSGNKMTIAAADIKVDTLAYPASRNVASPASKFLWATFALDAGASGEDVNVTTIIITDSYGGGANSSDIDSAELWADLTSATSDRGDIYETKISDTEQPAAADTTTSFVLSDTLTIPKSTVVKVALIADLVSGASGNHRFSIADADGNIVATGATTGESLVYGTGITITATNRQTLIAAGATLTAALSSNTPKSDIVIHGTEGVTLAVFRLSEITNAEDLELNYLTITGSKATGVSMYYLCDENDNVLASRATLGEFVVPDGALVIPANDHTDVSIKADLYPKAQSAIDNGDALDVSLAGTANVEVTGVSSGSTQANSTGYGAKAMYVYETRPYFSLNSSSPSGESLTPGSNTTVAIFDVEAGAGEEVTWDDDSNNQIIVKVNASIATTSQNYVTFRLWNATDNEVLGNASLTIGVTGAISDSITFDSTNAWGVAAGSTNDLAIPAGGTKIIEVQATTTDFTADADYIQVILEDDASNATGNCIFGINGSGNYSEGDYIFDGDIKGNAVSAPQ